MDGNQGSPTGSGALRDSTTLLLTTRRLPHLLQTPGVAPGSPVPGASAPTLEVYRPHLQQFERYLRYEKHRSEQTVRSYISDLEGFLGFAARSY